MTKASTSLGDWMQQIQSQNPRLESCCSILEALSQSPDLPKGREKTSTEEQELREELDKMKKESAYEERNLLRPFATSS